MSIKKIDTVIAKLEGLLGPKMEEFVERAGEKQKDLMIDLNLQQLDDGERRDGSKIEPEYSPTTKEIKKSQGRPTNKVTLFDQGNFYNSAKVEKHNKAFILEFKDEKTERLIGKYGEGIEGLSEENVAQVSQAMLPDIDKQARKYLKV